MNYRLAVEADEWPGIAEAVAAALGDDPSEWSERPPSMFAREFGQIENRGVRVVVPLVP